MSVRCVPSPLKILNIGQGGIAALQGFAIKKSIQDEDKPSEK